MTVKEETWKLTSRQREGRAINAVAELLRRTLSVPNIYLEPPASLISADILAVDRGGAGDLHAVEIKLQEAPIAAILNQLRARQEMVKGAHRQCSARAGLRANAAGLRVMAMPAHFRYLALPVESFDVLHEDILRLGLYAEDGIGRLGIIMISEQGTDSPIAKVAIAPERFRVDPAKLRMIETKLLAKSRPDIEVRI